MVIARVEALIAGQGQAEAKRRGEAYADAGADAIVIHSKSKMPDEIVAFIAGWERPTPLVIIPTAYPQLTEADIAGLGKVDAEIVPVGRIFELQGVGAMKENEKKYLR